MQKTALMSALLAALTYQPAAQADLESRLQETENRVRSLEDRILDTHEKPQEAAWSEHITFGGLIEVEAELQDPQHGDSESRLTLSTAELDISARISPTVRGDLVLLYEDDGENPLDVDVAAITYQPTAAWRLTAGRFYLPFGRYDTRMISDPLTLELGEIRETALLAGTDQGGFNGTLYLFNGDAREDDADRIDNFGIDLGYTRQGEGYGLAVALGYINDLGDSDGLIDTLGEIHERVGGLAFDVSFGFGPFTLIGGYVGAREAFESGDKPSAHNLEAAYAFTLFEREATLAVGHQGTRDAAATELPEKLALAALTVGVFDETAIGIEISSAEDYLGERSKALRVQLSTEF